jgi:hypothetical protein
MTGLSGEYRLLLVVRYSLQGRRSFCESKGPLSIDFNLNPRIQVQYLSERLFMAEGRLSLPYGGGSFGARSRR